MKILTTLHDYQERAVEKSSKRRYLLNTLKTGMGKTLVELATASKLLNQGSITKVLILTPKNAYMQRVWAKEVKKHTDVKSIDFEDYLERGGLDIPFVYGKHTHINTHFDALVTFLKANKVLLVYDEVAAFKNAQTKLTSKARLLNKCAVAVHGLTATPLSRSLADTYNIYNFIRPWCLGSFINFKKTYCNVEEEIIGSTKLPDGTRKFKKVERIKGFRDEELFIQATAPYTVRGESMIQPKFHFYNYKLSEEEFHIYRLIAKGISVSPDDPAEDSWLQTLLTSSTDATITERGINSNLEAHSSRFIYLQYAADGIIKPNGDLGRINSTKYNRIFEILRTIESKRESAIIYFQYYACLETFEYQLRKLFPNVRILKSTGEDTLSPNQLTELSVSKVPHVLLCTKAGSESSSFYFMNHVIFANIPTVPDTVTQLVGRITRVNTLFPDDLNVYFPRCKNIDDYKLFMVSHKTGLMETVAGREGNVPDLFKDIDWKHTSVRRYKNNLLWYKEY